MHSRSRLALGFLFVLGLCSANGRAEQQRVIVYNGHWWLSAPRVEQSGFLNGYFDCYCYEFKGTARFTRFPVDTYRLQLTRFYEEGTLAVRNELVSDALEQFRDPRGVRVIDKYAEHTKGPHGGDGGLYWRQMYALGGETQQAGFIAGYLWCHSTLNLNKGGVFSKTPAEYVSLITKWYGFDEKTGDVNGEREPASIAGVLMKLADRAQGDGRVGKEH